jgi:hypothetical protein
MNTFVRFFYEFVSIFFEGAEKIFGGLYNGLIQMFNIKEYSTLINDYKSSFQGFEWILLGFAVLILIIIFGLLLLLVYFGLRKVFKFGKNKFDTDELLEEISNLNDQVQKLMKEKDEIMAMKVSQLGLKPAESPEEEIVKPEETNEEDQENAGNIRFPKLVQIDEDYKNYKAKNYENNFTLEELLNIQFDLPYKYPTKSKLSEYSFSISE